MPKGKKQPQQPISNLVKRWPSRVIDIDDLIPADYNPRKITKHALEGLQNSLAVFGEMQPIVWNIRTGRVVGGHQRLEALKALGEKEVEVKVVDFDEEQERAANLTLNNPAIQGTWDDSKLEELLGELQGSSTFDTDVLIDVRLDELIAAFSTADVLAEDIKPSKEKLKPEDAGKDELSASLDTQPPVIQYNVVFDTETQQEKFYWLVKHLKSKYPAAITIGERFSLFVDELGI